jgi:hypothetical protein
VQHFDLPRNGRGAWLALVNLCKNKEYADIVAARYQGKRRNFTFAQYAALHEKVHNKLLELNDTVSGTKKVTDILAGISAP